METFPLTVKVVYEPEAKSAPYVAYTPELDVASCGPTIEKAKKNLGEAVEGFLESVAEGGYLEEVLADAGLAMENGKLVKKPFPLFDTLKIPLKSLMDLFDAPHYAPSLQKVG